VTLESTLIKKLEIVLAAQSVSNPKTHYLRIFIWTIVYNWTVGRSW